MTNLWSAEKRIAPVHLQAGCRKMPLDLALFFVFILCYFCVLGILCVLLFLGYCYFMLSVPVQLNASEDRPRNHLLCVERTVTLSNCSLTHSFRILERRGKGHPLSKSQLYFTHVFAERERVWCALCLLWPPCVIGQAIIFCPVVSSSSFYLFSIFFPRLISAVAGWMYAILQKHMVWP